MTAIEKYKLSFAKVQRFNGRLKVNSVNECFSSYLGEHKTIADASELLDGINTAISQNWQNRTWGFPTQGMIIAVIEADLTKVYGDLEEYANDKNIPPTFALPTLDFKEIVEAWIQFLNEMG